jgi:cytochrome b pre-mRNA-processing protein 3
MILQYFKKKENDYKIKSDKAYLSILNKSKSLLNKKYFNEIDFSISFELISILLIYHLKFFKNKNSVLKKRINEELMKNLVNDLDNSLRDVGIGDMSIGKYVKKYVKKFYYRLKILDPIFEDDNNEELINYVNSLKFVNKNNSNELVNQLSQFFLQIKNNNE